MFTPSILGRLARRLAIDDTASPALLLLGAILGFVTALSMVWGLPDPNQFVVDPPALSPEAKETYVLLVSMTYAQDGDFERAKQRLALLNDFELRSTLAALAARYTAELMPEPQRRALAKMAVAMGADSAALRVYAVTATPSAAPRPTATRVVQTVLAAETARTGLIGTPTPSPSPTQSPLLAYHVIEQARVPCDQGHNAQPQLLIDVQDARGQGVPGVRLRVQWNDGQDEFFTGLTGTDPGYAEFAMQPGKTYSLLVADGSSQIAFGLDSGQLDPGCPNDSQSHFKAWRILFRRVN